MHESGKARSLNMKIPFFIFLFSSILELLVFSGQSSSLFQSFHLFILYSISEWPEKPITSSKVGFLDRIFSVLIEFLMRDINFGAGSGR